MSEFLQSVSDEENVSEELFNAEAADDSIVTAGVDSLRVLVLRHQN